VLRQHVDVLREQELERAMRQLAPTLSEREAAAVRELTTRLMNKLLHTPTLRLKDAAAAGEGSFYAEALRYLFDLEEKHEANYSRDTSQQARHDTDTLGYNTASSPVA
jgi:glutamyl-tRNA reductase